MYRIISFEKLINFTEDKNDTEKLKKNRLTLVTISMYILIWNTLCHIDLNKSRESINQIPNELLNFNVVKKWWNMKHEICFHLSLNNSNQKDLKQY